MKASELRIGNLAEVDGNIWRVDSLVSNGHIEVYFKENEQYDHSFNMNPIPLTEEWLIKLGFEEMNYGFKHPKIKKKGRWIIYKNFPNNEKLENPYLRLDGLVDIYYVHQLQNLYFALCGDELNLK